MGALQSLLAGAITAQPTQGTTHLTAVPPLQDCPSARRGAAGAMATFARNDGAVPVLADWDLRHGGADAAPTVSRDPLDPGADDVDDFEALRTAALEQMPLDRRSRIAILPKVLTDQQRGRPRGWGSRHPTRIHACRRCSKWPGQETVPAHKLLGSQRQHTCMCRRAGQS